jgi:hypothetical protein
MKVSKILMTGVIALGLAGQAHANNTNYLVGSTAFRSATYSAIRALFSPGFIEVTYGNSTPAKCNQMMWIGTATNSGIAGTTVIKANWSGSVGGVRAIDGGILTGGFIADSKAAGNYSAVTTAANGTDPAFYDQTLHKPTVSMSDSFQSSTKYNATALNDDQVGIVPFEFIKNKGANTDAHWANLVNVTDPLIRVLLAGPLQLSLFTGNSADSKFVYAVGRSNDSGTRLGAFADTQFGIFTTPQQFDITASGANALLTLDNHPDVEGHPTSDGSQGYTSGGDVATAMSVAGSSTSTDPFNGGTGWYAIAYVGISDANTAIGNGAAALTYNGVAYTPNNVQNGEYGFWGYEHILSIPTLAGDGLTIKNDLKNTLLTGNFESLSGAGFEISTMNVNRPTDGGDVVHN